MKKILGLDLGTNSIGWALVEQDFEQKQGRILGLGTRIIPMSQDVLNAFADATPTRTSTAERTRYRAMRRLYERHHLRRERLHRVLNVLGFLPEHYAAEIDFEHRLGKFKPETEPKIAWKKNAAGQYEFVFQQSFQEMLSDFSVDDPNIKIPYDWTIYYLRKKALTQKISKQEFAWVILNFNQKRGYYQLRGDEAEENEENLNRLVEYHSLKVIDVIPDVETNKKGEIWYSVHLENGWIYRRSSKIDLSNWKGLTKEFIVTTELNNDGAIKTDKDGFEKRSFRLPAEDDWTLLKKKTEREIDLSNKTVGAYIYDSLRENPTQKIRGKLVRTIERKYYRNELKAIIQKQIELQPELFTEEHYNDCVRELYRSNEAHRIQLSGRDFVHLFVDDIIFYQRPLKSKKSTVSNCPLEYRVYRTTDQDGKIALSKKYLKAIPKSHPLYQEFRVWQWLFNLRIYRRDNNEDVTATFLPSAADVEKLFEFLMSQKEVDHVDILTHLLEPAVRAKYPGAKPKAINNELNKEISRYRWNYVFDETQEKEANKSKKYPMNTTGYEICRRLQQVAGFADRQFDKEKEIQLWHIIYSVTDKEEYKKALTSFARKHQLDEATFVQEFQKFPPFPSEYGSFSEKAIKKLLALMRLGKYWHWETIDSPTQQRIYRIINGEADESIKQRVREKAQTYHLEKESDFQGLPLWLAQYVVYDRHSEAASNEKWNAPIDLDHYLESFKQHSLRNPIVEQVVTETLRVVRDIWNQYGNGEKDFFDEIHVELGREMKQTAEERKRVTQTIKANEATNLRIKALLAELLNSSDGNLYVGDARPYSPYQQEALKIYEESVLSSGIEIPDDIQKISRSASPTSSELVRYKLWLEQKYRSPYTGRVISLTKLFSEEYQIEHVIPQSRYFDDSLSNKIICESAVNTLKDKSLGLEFIKKHGGEIVQDRSQRIRILTEEEYRQFVAEHYRNNPKKRKKLLMEEVPDEMIERQLNDTRYIGKFVSNVLSNIVRDEDGRDEEARSKNILPGNGRVTSTLRHEWGLDDVWNELILPRFERMNQLTGTNNYTAFSKKSQKTIPTVPLDQSKGFQRKRIDHRHHALDALVIACATREHIQYLNNENAHSQKRHLQFALGKKLRATETRLIDKMVKIDGTWQITGDKVEKQVLANYYKPWATFTADAKDALEKVVASFKQNIRILTKTTNKYEKFIEENGVLVKRKVKQTKGDNWAIRKPLHKETISARVHLPSVKVSKGKILAANRVPLDPSFNLKKIESITDSGIQKILKNYLISKNNNPDIAFSPEGLEELNREIARYNDDKPHQPIRYVRVFEESSRVQLGTTGNKTKKYVEAAKGTNLFFAVYVDEFGKRNYDTVPLNIVIERLKQGLAPVPEVNQQGHRLLFHLSPNDLVYVPTEDEIENHQSINFQKLTKEQAKRIYKMVSSTRKECHFIKSEIASLIKTYDATTKTGEMGSLNKLETTIDGQLRIKEVAIKLRVDRLGNISMA